MNTSDQLGEIAPTTLGADKLEDQQHRIEGFYTMPLAPSLRE